MVKSTVTTIAQAAKCVSKVKSGKACSMAELRATIILLDDAWKTSKKMKSMLKTQLKQESSRLSDALKALGSR